MRLTVRPSRPAGSLRLPPSKSMAHRLLLCAALAGGQSVIQNLDFSEDIRATCRALEVLGASISAQGGKALVQGLAQNPKSWSAALPADCGESGSTLRFLIPLFALSGKEATLTGARRLFQRPLSLYADIFAEQGLLFQPEEERLCLKGPLRGGNFTLAGNLSSQFLSGLLFALPLLSEYSYIDIIKPFESRDYVELTRYAQSLYGVNSRWEDENRLVIPGGQQYRPANAAVEGDWSQAGVPAVLGAVCGPLTMQGLNLESRQGDKAILDILSRCGASIECHSGQIMVSPPRLGLTSPGEIDLSACPDLGPVLCALALFCQGTTRIVNAGRLRIKESDRIATVESELKKLGGQISSGPDSITIQGGVALHGGAVLAHNDHRVVMALTVAAVCAGVSITIEGAEAVAKSWPSFFADLRNIGIYTEES